MRNSLDANKTLIAERNEQVFFEEIIAQSLHKKQLKYLKYIYQTANTIFHVHEKIKVLDSVQERDRVGQNEKPGYTQLPGGDTEQGIGSFCFLKVSVL